MVLFRLSPSESQSSLKPPVFILFVVSLSFLRERVRERERGYFYFPRRSLRSLATKKKEKITLSLVGIISLYRRRRRRTATEQSLREVFL